MRYIIASPSGEIVAHGTPSSAGEEIHVPDGHALIEHGTATRETHWVENGVVTEYSQQAKEALANHPGHGFEWSPAAGAWVDQRALADVQTALLAALKRRRDSGIEGGFVWDGSPFDSDTAVSQPRLLGLFTTAIAGGIPPEGYPWRLKNNEWRVLSALDAQQVWGTFQGHMAAHFAAFAVHEATVLAEVDIEALRSYDTEAGWP